MRNVIFPQKNSDEVLTLTFHFQDVMRFGEVITGAGVAANVFIGEDPAPEAILYNAPTIASDGFSISQVVIDGVPGVIYDVLATVNTSGGTVYSKAGKLAIVRPIEAFTGA